MTGFSRSLTSPIQNAIRGVQKASSFLPIYGVKGTMKELSKNLVLLQKVYRLEKYLVSPDVLLEPKIPLNVLTFSRKVNSDNWEGKKMIQTIRGKYGLDQFRERFARGDNFFCAYSEKAFVGFIWLLFPPVIEAGHTLRNDQSYLLDGWTFSPFRGKRVLPKLLQSVCDYLRIAYPHISGVVFYVATSNNQSLKACQRAGYTVTGLYLSFVLLGYHRKWKLKILE